MVCSLAIHNLLKVARAKPDTRTIRKYGAAPTVYGARDMYGAARDMYGAARGVCGADTLRLKQIIKSRRQSPEGSDVTTPKYSRSYLKYTTDSRLFRHAYLTTS